MYRSTAVMFSFPTKPNELMSTRAYFYNIYFSVMMKLGTAFEGSISRVELYDFPFNYTLNAAIINNEIVVVHPIIPWDNYEKTNVLNVYGSEYCIGQNCSNAGKSNILINI